MKKELDIITTKFEQVWPKDRRLGFWDFLTITSTLIFTLFFLLLFNPLGWVAIVICTLLYKFAIAG
jgi:hypothetical protein